MKIKSNPNAQFYLFVSGMALLLTFAIHPFLPDWFQKFKIDVNEDKRSIPTPNILYHDFDHDGFSELAALKYQKEIEESALKVYTYSGKLIEQWTFRERWISHSMIFGDYDHDGFDEVYIFTQNKDSLFLYAVNPRNREDFFIDRAFIARSPKMSIKRWDLRPISGIFVDVDGDGFEELIFNVMAGHALKPRRLYCYNIQKRRLLFSSMDGGAFLALPMKVMVNRQPMILMGGSVALENIQRRSPFSDHFAWLTVFKTDLSFAFPPVSFSGKNTQIKALPFGIDDGMIIVLARFPDNERRFSRLLLFDWNGKQQTFRDLKGLNWDLFNTVIHGIKTTLLVDYDRGALTVVDKGLMLSRKLNLPVMVDDFLRNDLDLDGDFESDWIGRSGKQLIIIDSDLSGGIYFPLKTPNWSGLNLSLKKNGPSPPQLSIQVGETKYLLRFYLNPFYPFFWTVHVLLFLACFGAVFLMITILNSISGYKNVLHTLLTNPDRGMMLLDNSGHIRYMNHTIIDQFGLGLTEYKGMAALELFEEFHSMHQLLKTLLEKNEKLREEISFQHNQISLKGEFYGHPIRVLFGYIYGYYVEINDYSKPVIDDRLRVWSKTVQKMAHDIKAPLSSITLNMTTLNLKIADTAPEVYKTIEPELKLMLKEINRVKEKTINFLKFTNLEKPRLTQVPIKEIIDRTLALFKNYAEKSVHFFVEIDPAIDKILVDEQQLQMALQAIVENAIDAIRGQGSIAITVRKTVSVKDNFKDFVEIEIADTGPGIPQEIKDRIFEPYVTTKKEGTGMGLAIAQKIVREHDGEIYIYSREEFSTVVKIMLPFGNSVDNFQQDNG